MTPRIERTLLAALLIAFAGLAIGYSVVVPPFEASDELWHYPMVRTIARNWRLPIQDPADFGPWRQEGSQPPLYYLLGAVATAWIDTSDMDTVRHLNVHVDNGVATADGNVNLVVHDPEREAFPWRGTILAVHIVRLLSVGLGTFSVYLTWRIAREIAPRDPAVALAAAGIHAFTPMHVFVSGAVNNDNLVIPLCSLSLLMLIRLVDEHKPKRQGETERRDGMWVARAADGQSRGSVPLRAYLSIGVVLGLAALTKTSSLALTLLTAVVVTARALRRRSWREFIAGGLATLCPVLVIAGWWYVRNLHLYGDLSGLSRFVQILGKRDVPANAAQLWRERFSFAAGYWGNFGGLNVPMPGWSYRTLNWLAIFALGGLAVMVGRWIPALRREPAGRLGGLYSTSRPRGWPLALTVLWGLGVVIPWSQWAAITWSSQGRLVFAALAVWSSLLALGLRAWFPRALGLWVLSLVVLLLIGLSAAALVIWIPAAYQEPHPLGVGDEVLLNPSDQMAFFEPETGGQAMKLLGYDVATNEVAPGGSVDVTLYWEALAATKQDSTVFVQLIGDGDLVVAQRDTFPALGLLTTKRLEPGRRWADRYVLQVPETAFAPDSAVIHVGLYDTASGTRFLARSGDGDVLGDYVPIGRVDVRRAPDAVASPVGVRFGRSIELVGYDLDRRTAVPGQAVRLTLWWRARRSMETDYTVSAQLVGDRQRKAAQVDGWPRGGAAPTSSWGAGQVVSDTIELAVSRDAEPGSYDVRVAVYVLDEAEIDHVPVIHQDGRMLADHIVLTKVRVAPR